MEETEASAPKVPRLSREEFEALYVAGMGLSREQGLAWLADHNRTVEPCDCDYKHCQGWKVTRTYEPDYREAATHQ
jgi:hypothetical protein